MSSCGWLSWLCMRCSFQSFRHATHNLLSCDSTYCQILGIFWLALSFDSYCLSILSLSIVCITLMIWLGMEIHSYSLLPVHNFAHHLLTEESLVLGWAQIIGAVFGWPILVLVNEFIAKAHADFLELLTQLLYWDNCSVQLSSFLCLAVRLVILRWLLLA